MRYAIAFGIGFAACMVMDAVDFLQRRPPWPERWTLSRRVR